MEVMEDVTTFERKLFQNATQKKIPLYGVLELTPLCNMNCDMCYVRLNKTEMESQGRLRTIEEWLSLAADMQKAGTLFVLLTGGEPLLYPEFQKLYLELHKMGMIVTINTNGTLIDEKWAEFFGNIKPRRINITLYGASEHTYDNLCHYPKGYKKAINGIRLLREHGVDVKINGSLVKANFEDRMKIIEIGEVLGAPVRIDTYMYPAVRERNRPFSLQSRLNPEVAAEAQVEIFKKEMDEDTFRAYIVSTLEKVENISAGKEEPCCMRCRAGQSSFSVNWQGKLRPCIVMNSPSKSVFEIGLDAAWKQIVDETEKIRISSKCSQCKLRMICNTCAAAALFEEGGQGDVPEYICRYTKKIVKILQDEYGKINLEIRGRK